MLKEKGKKHMVRALIIWWKNINNTTWQIVNSML
jgi:hypothetical protein